MQQDIKFERMLVIMSIICTEGTNVRTEKLHKNVYVFVFLCLFLLFKPIFCF